MTPDQTALLRRILDHSRVRKYGEGRGWYARTGVETRASGHGDRVRAGRVEVVYDPPRYTGPDLALDANLHELLALADAMGDFDVDVMADCYQGSEHFSATMYTNANKETGISEIHRGHGPTRTLAVLAALGRALNIGDTE